MKKTKRHRRDESICRQADDLQVCRKDLVNKLRKELHDFLINLPEVSPEDPCQSQGQN